MTDPTISQDAREAAALMMSREDLVEWLYEHDPMCGAADCEYTAARLWPIIGAKVEAHLRTPATDTEAMRLLREKIRLFPEAHDTLTNQELRDAKGNWRSLIDQQTNALRELDALAKGGV